MIRVVHSSDPGFKKHPIPDPRSGSATLVTDMAKELESGMYQEMRAREAIKSSVADPGCLSRIPDRDFYPSRIPDLGSRIPDPKTATKERGEKN